jgi:hypothetical protein
MRGELVYDIARFSEDPESGESIKRIQVFADGGTFWLRDEDGTEHPFADSDISSIVASTEALHQIRPSQLTKITGGQSIVNRLPLLLTVPPAPTNPTDIYREAQVNGVDWWAYETTDGVRMLPYGGSEYEPRIDPSWVYASFIETDSRTSGMFSGQLGLTTPDVVVDFLNPDDDPNRLSVRRRGDDAQDVTDWLLHGEFYRDFWGDRADGRSLMTQLFVEAVCNASKPSFKTPSSGMYTPCCTAFWWNVIYHPSASVPRSWSN